MVTPSSVLWLVRKELMIDFLRHLIAAPLKILYWLCGYFPIFSQLSLQEKIFFLTRDVGDGVVLVWLTNKKLGIESARAKAERILERCQSAKISYMIAVLEMNNNRGFTEAAKWVEGARQANYSDQYMLYYLELIMSNYFDGYEGEQIVDKMLACKCLPPEHTRIALLSKQEMLLEKQQWAEAEEIADRMLSIKEDPDVRIKKWIVCHARGDHAQADKHLSAARGKMPEDAFNLLVGEGYLYLGDEPGAMEHFYEAMKKGFKFEGMRSDSMLGRMLHSERFKDYCAERG